MYMVDTACCHVLWPSSHEHPSTQQQQQQQQQQEQQQHSAALEQHSIRATLDSSSTRTPVVAVVLVLRRAARAALERTSIVGFQAYFFLFFLFFLFFSTSLFLFTLNERLDKAVVTGVHPFPPRCVPLFFVAHRVQHSHCSSSFIK